MSVALDKLKDRQNVGVVGGDHDLAVCAWLVAIDVVLRQTLEFSRTVDLHLSLIVGDIAFVERYLPRKIVIELFNACAGGVILIDAGQTKLKQLRVSRNIA